MAPTAPSKGGSTPSARTLRMQRITGQIHPLLPSKVFRSDARVSDDFLRSKRDKRLMKHSLFVSRIAASSAGISKKAAARRRRPKNKLVTSLDALADALPDLTTSNGKDGQDALLAAAGKVRHRSIKSKKGALRKKETIVRGEMERFGVNMAHLTGARESHPTTEETGTRSQKTYGEDENTTAQETKTAAEKASAPAAAAAAAGAATSNRWAALRGYISATMEQNPAFAATK
ncbi:hypothetical protein AAL_07171 [Moelleriella libera RCEF 2490]|uniref:Ribosome biogenesis protein SLX9 n=1 Tax=Moelleriella libera RCEF 2490 TaxID=1081109 RepID=A0A167XUJ9_9HYPO|nr:hypothetical protein AAL_07171 [Moelleriella libera RCEF 2490]